jgi:hypothetical protein
MCGVRGKALRLLKGLAEAFQQVEFAARETTWT